jgi:hypothetical protein
MRPVEELLLLIAATRERRSAQHARLAALVRGSDERELESRLVAHRLLPLGGARLAEAGADRLLSNGFRARWRQDVEDSRRRAVALEALTVRVIDLLERDGVRALPLKGPLLARALYGDPAMRPTNDIDLLVSADDLPRAVEAVRGLGYREPAGTPSRLPALHRLLAHEDPWMPRLELHWRIHWYESRFSAELLARARPDDQGLLRPAPAEELAMLLLFFARDGFYGLRLAADVAACWDACASELECGALERLVCKHPALCDAVTTAAGVAESLVGLPAGELGLAPDRRARRAALAARLANWSQRGVAPQAQANVRLVDWLLTPAGGHGEYVRRNFLSIPGELAGGPAPRSRALALLVHSLRLLARYGLALWALRGGRRWSPLPDSR